MKIGLRIKDWFCKKESKPSVNDSDMKDLLYEVLSHYGMIEVPGPDSNPDILEFFKDLGYDWVTDDSATAWCSAMLSYYAKKLGYEYNKDLNARGWLDTPVKVLHPSIGDVVVFWRYSPTDWRGHVGLFISWDSTKIWVLGGNQQNQISIAAYSRDRLLGFRQLKRLYNDTD